MIHPYGQKLQKEHCPTTQYPTGASKEGSGSKEETPPQKLSLGHDWCCDPQLPQTRDGFLSIDNPGFFNLLKVI